MLLFRQRTSLLSADRTVKGCCCISVATMVNSSYLNCLDAKLTFFNPLSTFLELVLYQFSANNSVMLSNYSYIIEYRQKCTYRNWVAKANSRSVSSSSFFLFFAHSAFFIIITLGFFSVKRAADEVSSEAKKPRIEVSQ